jgi:hypothetical protein
LGIESARTGSGRSVSGNGPLFGGDLRVDRVEVDAL